MSLTRSMGAAAVLEMMAAAPLRAKFSAKLSCCLLAAMAGCWREGGRERGREGGREVGRVYVGRKGKGGRQKYA